MQYTIKKLFAKVVNFDRKTLNLQFYFVTTNRFYC